MKISTLILAALAVSLPPVTPAQASGCMGYDEYELGHSLGAVDTIGTFSCREFYKGGNGCELLLKDGQQEPLSARDVPTEQLPPVNQAIHITFHSYEAMHWSNCDGGDPVPPFVKNGIYDFFDYGGRRYERFTNESVHTFTTVGAQP